MLLVLILYLVYVVTQEKSRPHITNIAYFDLRQVSNNHIYEYVEGVKVDSHGDTNSLNISTGDNNTQSMVA